MVKKKRVEKVKKSVRKSIKKSIGEEIVEDIQEIEKWIVERRKFFIKLGWVVGLVVGLLIFSNWFMRVQGFG